MASWSLLLALSGYHYSAPERRLAFAPRINATNFRCLFTTGSGWGTFRQRVSPGEALASLELVGGTLSLAELGLQLNMPETATVAATVGGRSDRGTAADRGWGELRGAGDASCGRET